MILRREHLAWHKNCNNIDDIPISTYGLQVNEERIPKQSLFHFSTDSRKSVSFFLMAPIATQDMDF